MSRATMTAEGDRLFAARRAVGFTQRRLAREAGGLDATTISKLERGGLDRVRGVLQRELVKRVRDGLEEGTVDPKAAAALAALQESELPRV
ncbi:MAG TPA: helix-turn-helix domain-containing protein [Solirubrobacteraceae bacterium]|nr:helix-turn-helix domain-containing protein [Solirubrobacteraceae bacterium]